MTTSQRTIEVHAPSRLHFGLFSFGDPNCPHQFGGVGAMIRSPGVHLRFSDSRSFCAEGKHAERAAEMAERVAKSFDWPGPPNCLIEVVSAPRQHVGLGAGTQLGMAIAAGLMRWRGMPESPAQRLAQATGRGERSSVGAHGFAHGGLIVDSGHTLAGKLGGVEANCPIPTDWRFVLAIDTRHEGLAQYAERNAFAQLSAVPTETTQRLRGLAVDHLVPAIRQADHGRFAESLYEYGVLAGHCFAAVQGGPFASDAIARRVELIRSLGYAGCGQSSWGPTVFTVTPDEASAEELVNELRRVDVMQSCELLISEPANRGAIITPPCSTPTLGHAGDGPTGIPYNNP